VSYKKRVIASMTYTSKYKGHFMYTTYHLSSPQEINNDIIEAIKAAFKGKQITLTIEEDNDETAFLMANDKNREILMKSIAQDRAGEFVTVKIEE
jgi:tRNA A37 methylthiotransferase MiaB